MYPFVYTKCSKCGNETGRNITTLSESAAAALNGLSDGTETPEHPELQCRYPQCRPTTTSSYRYHVRNAQVGADEAAAVAVRINPQTGKEEIRYCFFAPGDPLPERYAAQGFQKQQFHSLSSLRAFCSARGLRNDIEYDNKHEGTHEEGMRAREEWERTRDAKYQQERREVERAMNDERRSQRR